MNVPELPMRTLRFLSSLTLRIFTNTNAKQQQDGSTELHAIWLDVTASYVDARCGGWSLRLPNNAVNGLGKILDIICVQPSHRDPAIFRLGV